MPEFIKIAEAISQKKGDFVGVVIKAGDLKSGTTDKGDWTLKVYTIEDASGQIEFLAWKESERTLQLGHSYEFVNPWYKDKDGKVSIQASQYGKINHLDVAPKEQAPAAEPPKEVEAPSGELPKLNPNIADLVSKDTVLMMQVKEEIKATIIEVKGEQYFTALQGQEFGMMVKEIFRHVLAKVPDHG